MPRHAPLALALLALAAPLRAEEASNPVARLAEATLAAAMAFPEEIAHLRRALPRWPVAPGRAEALPLPEAAEDDPWLGAVRIRAFPGGGVLELACRRMGAGLMPLFEGGASGPFAAMAREAAHLPSAYIAIQRCDAALALPASEDMRAEITDEFQELVDEFTADGYDPAVTMPALGAPLAAALSGYGPVCRWDDCVTALALEVTEENGHITLHMSADSAREP